MTPADAAHELRAMRDRLDYRAASPEHRTYAPVASQRRRYEAFTLAIRTLEQLHQEAPSS